MHRIPILLSWFVLSLPFLVTPFFVSLNLRFIFPVITIGFLVWLLKKDNRYRVFVFLLVSYFVLFAFLLTDVILILFQGKTFDLRFFDLLNFEMMLKGVELFPLYTLIIGGCLVVVAVMLHYIFKKLKPFEYVQSKFSSVMMLIIFLFILLLPNSFSLFTGKLKNYYSYNESIHESSLPKIDLKATKGKNLLLIYLESYEKEFIEKEYFPTLAPFLQELSQNAISFENHQMTIGANFTMAGIFASQCGATFHYQDVDNVVCLGDILHQGGYHQVFMQAADLKFEQKDKYFSKYHFDEILGQETLVPKGDNPDKKNFWGIFDEDLYDYVYDKFLDLNKKYLEDGTPYHLSMLTVDTHDGSASPTCLKYDGKFSENRFFQSYHCADYLLEKFIKKIKSQEGSEDLVIAIVGDHLQNFDIYASQLKHMNRRVLALIDTQNKIQKIIQPTAHIDFVQTLLPLLEVDTNANFIFGGDALKPLPTNHLKTLYSTKEQEKKLFQINSVDWLSTFGLLSIKKLFSSKKIYKNKLLYSRHYSKKEIKKNYFPIIKTFSKFIQNNDLNISYSVDDDLLFVQSKNKILDIDIDIETNKVVVKNKFSTTTAFIYDNNTYVWDMGNFSYKNGKVNNLVLQNINYDNALGNLTKPKNIHSLNELTKLVIKDESILFKFNLQDPKESMSVGVILEYAQSQKVAEFDLADLYEYPSYHNRMIYKVLHHGKIIYEGDVSDARGTQKKHIKVEFIEDDRNITIVLQAQKGIEKGWAWGNAVKIKVDVEN